MNAPPAHTLGAEVRGGERVLTPPHLTPAQEYGSVVDGAARAREFVLVLDPFAETGVVTEPANVHTVCVDGFLDEYGFVVGEVAAAVCALGHARINGMEGFSSSRNALFRVSAYSPVYAVRDVRVRALW